MNVILSVTKRAGVSADDAGERVKWKSRTRVADPK